MTGGLAVESIEVAYGDVIAVWDVSFVVRPGEVVGMVGRNGVGKSTTVNAIAGLLPLRSGAISLDGSAIDHLRVDERAALGLAVVPEGRRIFRSFTVERNLALGSLNVGDNGAGVSERLQLIYERLPILADRRTQVAGSLSGGQQQLLAIAQALVAHPRYLVLDEPTAGLSPVVIRDVYELTAAALGDGIGVLLVEERADLVADVASRIVRIDRGRVVSDSVSPDITEPPPSSRPFSLNGTGGSTPQHSRQQGDI